MPIATILGLLQALAGLEPLAAEAVPIIQNLVAGGTPSAADIATLENITATLNEQAAAAETAAGATEPAPAPVEATGTTDPSP